MSTSQGERVADRAYQRALDGCVKHSVASFDLRANKRLWDQLREHIAACTDEALDAERERTFYETLRASADGLCDFCRDRDGELERADIKGAHPDWDHVWIHEGDAEPYDFAGCDAAALWEFWHGIAQRGEGAG